MCQVPHHTRPATLPRGAYTVEDSEGLRVQNEDISTLCPQHQTRYGVILSVALLQGRYTRYHSLGEEVLG